jgi:arylsulfatase A-like enzyme
VPQHYGIRTQRFKLIHFDYNGGHWELYDLEKDPNEMRNIYDISENQQLVNVLKGKLLKLQHEYMIN